MKNYMLIFILTITLGACVSIPKESYELNEIISVRLENQRKYQEKLINELIAEKKDNVNDYIQHDYLPTLLKNIKQLQKEKGLDTTLTKSNVIAISSKAIENYNTQVSKLESLRAALLTSSNDYYLLTIQANQKVSDFLRSAVKVEDARSEFINTVSEETGLNINLEAISQKLDSALLKGGDVSKSVESIIKNLK